MKCRAQNMVVEALSDLLLLDPVHWSPCGGEVLLDVKGWIIREQVLESARRYEPRGFSGQMDGYCLPLGTI